MAASLVRSVLRASSAATILRPCLASSTALRQNQRGYKRYMRSYLSELYHRRLEVGPEKLHHRSEFVNWNYNAEVYAFGKRLGEEFSSDSLQTAFTDRSYIEKEEEKRAELGIDLATAPLGLTDNGSFSNLGRETASRCIKAYIRSAYPNLFEEGVIAIHDHLMDDSILADIACHIGISDLLLCSEFPPEDETLSRCFFAVLGAIETDRGTPRAEGLVRDLVMPVLVGEDLSELWSPADPMSLLSAVLTSQGRGLPEPRLQWAAGQNTVMATYQVGIYSDRQLIGQAAGERVNIAEEMAAHNALQRMMGIGSDSPPFPVRNDDQGLGPDSHSPNTSASQMIQRMSTN